MSELYSGKPLVMPESLPVSASYSRWFAGCAFAPE